MEYIKRPNGEHALTYFFDQSITWLHGVCEYLHTQLPVGPWEVIPSANSITIINQKLTLMDIANVIEKTLEDYRYCPCSSSQHHQIGVCYHPSLGIDIQHLSQHAKLSVEQLIARHTAPVYRVNMLGFLPGFGYLQGLDPLLHCPRRSEPRVKTPAGAVAIGGDQTGIYPVDSPGGWHIIGMTNHPLIIPESYPPVTLQALDTVKFHAISLEQYQQQKGST